MKLLPKPERYNTKNIKILAERHIKCFIQNKIE
jgi:hypothetical protein